MPVPGDVDRRDAGERPQTEVDHSGARWMLAVGLCLLMLGVACVL
jgi:hypothetical protein